MSSKSKKERQKKSVVQKKDSKTTAKSIPNMAKDQSYRLEKVSTAQTGIAERNPHQDTLESNLQGLKINLKSQKQYRRKKIMHDSEFLR